MMRKSIVYSLTLSGIDILVFFLVYFTFSLLSKNFNFASAMMDGGLAILARFLYLQIFVQFFLIFFIHRLSFDNNYIIVVIGIILSYLLTSIVIFRDPAGFINSFSFSFSERALGPGLALVLSSSIAWVILQRRWHR